MYLTTLIFFAVAECINDFAEVSDSSEPGLWSTVQLDISGLPRNLPLYELYGDPRRHNPHYYWYYPRTPQQNGNYPYYFYPSYPQQQQQQQQQEQQQSCSGLSIDPIQLLSQLENTVHGISEAKTSLARFIDGMTRFRFEEIPREIIESVHLAISVSRSIQRTVSSMNPGCMHRSIQGAFTEAISGLRHEQKSLARVVSELIRNPLGELQNLKGEYHDLEESLSDTVASIVSFLYSKHQSDVDNANSSGEAGNSNGNSFSTTSSDSGFAAFTDFSVPAGTSTGPETETQVNNKYESFTVWDEPTSVTSTDAAITPTSTDYKGMGRMYTFTTSEIFTFTGTPRCAGSDGSSNQGLYTFTASGTYMFNAQHTDAPQIARRAYTNNYGSIYSRIIRSVQTISLDSSLRSSYVTSSKAEITGISTFKSTSPLSWTTSLSGNYYSTQRSASNQSKLLEQVVECNDCKYQKQLDTADTNIMSSEAKGGHSKLQVDKLETLGNAARPGGGSTKTIPDVLFTESVGPLAPKRISFVQHYSVNVA